MIVRFLDVGGIFIIIVYALFSIDVTASGGHLYDKERLTVLHIYIYIYQVQNSVFADRYVPEKLLRCGGGKELKNEL